MQCGKNGPQLWATGDWQLHHDNGIAHILCLLQRFFCQTSNHLDVSAPLHPSFGALQLLAFPITKITFEREEIWDHPWRSGKYDKAADGDSNKGFCRVFWTVEETLGELCEVPQCLLWRGLRCYCFIYNVSYSRWLDTFQTDTHMVVLASQNEVRNVPSASVVVRWNIP